VQVDVGRGNISSIQTKPDMSSCLSHQYHTCHIVLHTVGWLLFMRSFVFTDCHVSVAMVMVHRMEQVEY